MGTIKAAVWSALSASFVYLYMTNHFIKANWVALVWIVMFAWQITVSTTKKGTTHQQCQWKNKIQGDYTMKETYTEADLIKAWKSGYEEGYQDALIDNYLEAEQEDELKHDQEVAR